MGGGGGGGHKSTVYVFENKNILSDILQLF